MVEDYNSKVVLANGKVLIDLTADTVDEASVLSGRTFHDKSGAPKTGSCTYDSDTSADTAAVGEILEGKTAHARGAKLSGTMPNNGAVSGTISTKDGSYTVPQGYHDGSGKVQIAAAEREKLIAQNIRQGVNILGIDGEMSPGEGVNAQSRSATPKFSEQIISPESGYTHLSAVTIAPITVTYSDNAAGGKTVTIGAV